MGNKEQTKELFRRQGVFCFVPAEYREAFWQLAQQQRSRSFSDWLRPKLLGWLAQERPDLRKEINEFLKAEEILAGKKKPRGQHMQNKCGAE